MFSQKSIRAKFITQLVLASAVLIVLFSSILYHFIQKSIYEIKTEPLINKAKLIKSSRNIQEIQNEFILYSPILLKSPIKVEFIIDKKINYFSNYKTYMKDGKHYLVVYYLFNKKDSKYILLTKEITNTNKILNKILIYILVINLTAIFLVLLYALLISRMILNPIKALSNKLSNMDEHFFQSIDISHLPTEFKPLGRSINTLTNRIQTFLKYQKELFIGIAHELKTPLAIMKAKHEVTLMKPREQERYIDDLRNNIKIINEMNNMISSILEIGRQECDQFEKLITIDIIEFLKEKSNNFKIIANQENKQIQTNLLPKTYNLKTQPRLLQHILQNFVQNALKFSPENGIVKIKSFKDVNGFFIQVIDDGIGINESKDYFAPFKRFGNKSGVGLGLFLAKNAADALGAKVSLENRRDTNGTIATLFIPKEIKNHNTKILY